MEATNSDAALDLLSGKSLIVISLKEQRGGTNFLAALNGLFSSVSKKDLAVMLRQLAILISASIPVVQALKMLALQTVKPNLKAAIVDISNEVEGGTKLSDALARYPNIFDNFFVNMVRSGETSGKLDEILVYLADQQEKDYELQSRVQGAMIYPAFIISVVVVAGFVLMTWIMPKILTMFKEFGNVQLPLPTRILIVVSDFMQGYWWLIILLAAGAFVGGRLFVKTPAGRRVFGELILRIPVLGPLFQYVYTVRFTRSFGTVLVGGVTVPAGLRVVRDIVGNAVYEDLIDETIREVEDGNPVSSVFSKSKYVPSMVSQMLAVGEQTGRLDDVLEKITTFFTREINTGIQNVVTLIEPIIIIVIGLAVAVMVAAIILPMYNLATAF